MSHSVRRLSEGVFEFSSGPSRLTLRVLSPGRVQVTVQGDQQCVVGHDVFYLDCVVLVAAGQVSSDRIHVTWRYGSQDDQAPALLVASFARTAVTALVDQFPEMVGSLPVKDVEVARLAGVVAASQRSVAAIERRVAQLRQERDAKDAQLADAEDTLALSRAELERFTASLSEAEAACQ